MIRVFLVALLAVGLLGCDQPTAPKPTPSPAETSAKPTASAATAETPVFTFTAIPDQDETRLIERFSQVETYLQEQLGIEVKYIPVKSYAAAVTAFAQGQVQLAWFGGLSGVQARLQVENSEAIAQGFEDPYFTTYFIAHHSTGLTASESFPDEIKGRSFTFGSKGSTSGRLMPEFFIREHYNDIPENIFSRVGFSGDHSTTIALVESGSYEIGAVNYKVWEKEVAAGDVDTDKVSLIWKTPPYPDYHWVIRGDVDSIFGESTISAVKTALLTLTDENILNAFPRKSFIEATNEDYQPILETGKKIGLID